jgi:hypothetical protein
LLFIVIIGVIVTLAISLLLNMLRRSEIASVTITPMMTMKSKLLSEGSLEMLFGLNGLSSLLGSTERPRKWVRLWALQREIGLIGICEKQAK